MMDAGQPGVEFFWRIPTHGDGRTVTSNAWNRGDWHKPADGNLAPGYRNGAPDAFAFIDYMSSVARAAEMAGFDGALVPSAIVSDEPLMVAAALARETRTLRMMTAFQPGFIAPAYAAKMGATLQRILGGRLEWNIITGGSPAAQLAYGDTQPHDERYARTGEWLDVVRGMWRGGRFDHEGRFYTVKNGALTPPLLHARMPGVYFSGASDAALEVAARHADVYLMWIEPLDATRALVAKLNGMAAAHGRRPRYGVRVDIFARASEAEAWDEARRLWAAYDPAAPKKMGGMNSASGAESAGAVRQAALRPTDARSFEDYIIGPNMWAGLGAIRPGPTIGLFGSYDQVADRLMDYIAAGATDFILAANPHLEEALRVGEEVLPRVRAKLSTQRSISGISAAA